MNDLIAHSERPLILGTGLLALDVIVGADPGRPATLAAGGTCGNVLTVLSFLGWDALPIARLNGDAASRLLCEDLERWGVSLKFVDRTPCAPTPIIVQRNQRGRDTSFLNGVSGVWDVVSSFSSGDSRSDQSDSH